MIYHVKNINYMESNKTSQMQEDIDDLKSYVNYLMEYLNASINYIEYIQLHNETLNSYITFEEFKNTNENDIPIIIRKNKLKKIKELIS